MDTKATDIDERVEVKNPNTGRDDLRIRRSVYEPVRRAILAAVAAPEGVANSQLRAAVEANTPDALWVDHSPGWYTTTVKLDLEARGLLTKSGSPQHLHLTDAGRAALEAGR